MSGTIFFRGGGFEVTDRVLRTRRKTYRLAQIEYVSVERPLLIVVLPLAAAAFGLAAAFSRYLYPGEIGALVAIGAAAALAGLSIGTLQVHSLALRDHEVATSLGPVRTLRQVRRAIEEAMSIRDAREMRDAE
ncbi:MAG: hypothetical protein BGO82_10720 [Devosia sp. 67-54]|uniref:hypothetical protein n=1 Tax=unclassified Devosia TaxID=196773 RepID=UPI0009605ECE|nr:MULTISPECIES: hypothetical protein [unclassified Devosia]MBN9304892.1 hypothetical protein [Devosia sp.]OJX15156.1 MAG: hypothetical protein BGO82_10720 [Devosia sp. 67-54]